MQGFSALNMVVSGALIRSASTRASRAPIQSRRPGLDEKKSSACIAS